MYEYRATVIRVIDGDTLEVDIDLGFKTTLKKEKLRLLGIDTSELRSSDPEEREHAQKAKAFVQSLLPIGKEVILHTKKDRKGKYGRYLATVMFTNENHITPVSLSYLLNENGYAKKKRK